MHVQLLLVHIIYVLVVVRWTEPVTNVSENAGFVTLCAFADGWTTDDSTLRIPLSTLTDTAAGDLYSIVITVMMAIVCLLFREY